jgi:glutathione S-transferase
MAVKFHRCSAMWVKINGHPCWKAQKALDDAGVDYELVLHSGLRFRRPEVAEMTGGPKALPIIEFEDGSLLRESSVIAERAKSGTLLPTAPAAAPEPPPASPPPDEPAAPTA